MSLLCKLSLHKWEGKGKTKVLSKPKENLWKVTQQCKRCGEFRRVMQREGK